MVLYRTYCVWCIGLVYKTTCEFSVEDIFSSECSKVMNFYGMTEQSDINDNDNFSFEFLFL